MCGSTLWVKFSGNKKSHCLQISASKLLEDWSGNIKMPNIFFEQNLQAEKVNITTESYIFQLV